MDELEIRRRLYSNPKDDDPELKAALMGDESARQFAEEIQQLDSRLEQAMRVDVPEGLADRLILNQSMHSFQQQRRQTRVWLAAAASVAFAVGLSFSLWTSSPRPFDIGEHALAHVYHEMDYLNEVDEQVSLQQVNSKLATLGGEMTADLGRHIYFTNFCDFEGTRSLHMILEGEQGKVSVFFVPSTQSKTPREFSDNRFAGVVKPFGDMDMVVVGERGEPVEQLEQSIAEKLIWQSL